MPRIVFWLYVLIASANVFSKIIPSPELDQYTKPLLMPLLIFYVYRSSLGKTTLRILILCAALLFSWLGDISLIYKSGDTSFFMIGIGLFLVAQILYIITLRKSSYQKPLPSIPQTIPFLLYAGLLFYLLLPADDFTIPIIVYGSVIVMMAITARGREGNTSQNSFHLALFGSFFFILSDSFMAYHSFKSEIPYAGVWVMLTYWTAQLLLTEGILKHEE